MGTLVHSLGSMSLSCQKHSFFCFERELFTHSIFSAVFIKLRKFFTYCQLKEEFIKLRKFFATCLLIAVLIKLRKCLMNCNIVVGGYKPKGFSFFHRDGKISTTLIHFL